MSEYSINLESRVLFGPTEVSVIMPNPPLDRINLPLATPKLPEGKEPKHFYSSGKKYKVLWLLHAGDGDRNDWLRFTTLSRLLSTREVIAVIPNGLNSDFANHPEFSDGYNFSDYFLEELMPFIYNWFPASADPKDNFLAGVSLGGAAAWMYGIKYPEKFAAIAPISSAPKKYEFLEPYRALTAAEFKAKAVANPKTFPTQFGDPTVGIRVKELNMIIKYPTVGDFLDSYEHTWVRFREAAAAGRLPRTYLPCGNGCGPSDNSANRVKEFRQYAEGLGVKDIVFDFVPGYGHNWEFWQHILPKVLEFFSI